MADNADGTGTVSWELFNDLYENQYDLLRKLRFFIKAGRCDKDESLALNIMEDFLSGKELELESLRQRGLEEWKANGQPAAEPPMSSDDLLSATTRNGPDKSLALREDIRSGRIALWSRLKSREQG